MKAFVQIARFENVLTRLPSGLETSIAEKGVNLSGGEKQRLALARGVYFARSSDVVLLDEPTSSVDTYNERQIYDAVLKTFADKVHRFIDTQTAFVGNVRPHLCFRRWKNRRKRNLLSELTASGGKLAEMWKNFQVSDAVVISDSLDFVEAGI